MSTRRAANWLIAGIERDGAAAGAADLALVVKVLESALNCPESLKAWALGRIEAAVLTGEGPTRSGPPRPMSSTRPRSPCCAGSSSPPAARAPAR